MAHHHQQQQQYPEAVAVQDADGSTPTVVASPFVNGLTATGLSEEAYASQEAQRTARHISKDMRQVLSAANRVARERARYEESLVRDADRRARRNDLIDPTYQYPVVATPIQREDDDAKVKKENQEPTEEQPQAGYKIGDYQTQDYDIKEYKSIYDP